MSVRKGNQDESLVLTSEGDTDMERGEGSLTCLVVTTTASVMKKKLGMMKKVKTKTKPPSLSKQGIVVSAPPPITRRPSSGRSSSRSRRESFDVGVGETRINSSVSRSRSRQNRGFGGTLLGMTATATATSGERKKPVIVGSTKSKSRPKFVLGRSASKGGTVGKVVGGDGRPSIIKKESSGDGNSEKERKRGRERTIVIQMQRRQRLLIQQQQQRQLEMKQREDGQRALTVQLARQEADLHEAESRRQRQLLHQELHRLQQQQQQGYGGTNGLLGVSSKRPPAPPHYPAPLHHPPQHHQQIIQEREQVAERQLQKEEKGKEKEHSSSRNTRLKPGRSTSKSDTNNVHPLSAPPPTHNMKNKQSTHQTLNMVSSVLAAQVKHTLSDPLLPGQHKGMIVLTTSESDFEDSDDDGSWSSEEMRSENEEEKRPEESQKQSQLLAEQYYQQQQLQQRLQQQLQQQQQLHQQQLQQIQQLQQQQSAMQRAHSSTHYPNHNHNHTSNRTQRTASGRVHRHTPHHAQLAQAAQEAQRQREMFVKKPVESFQNLTQIARTRSVGLLTQLMNPDPEIFPIGHPYGRGYSSSEIRGVGGEDKKGGDRDGGCRPVQPLKVMERDNQKLDEDPPSRPEAVHRKSSSPSTHSRATVAAMSPPVRTFSAHRSKRTAAVPVSSQVQVGSVTSNVGGEVGVANAGFGVTNMKMGPPSGGYRPKGPPQDQELEDKSGSEAEPGGGIQVSKSVALEKLKALAERRGIVTHGNQPTTSTKSTDSASTTTGANYKRQLGDEDDVPQWAKVSQPRVSTRTRSQDQYQQSQAPNHNMNRRSLSGFMIPSTTNQPTPIPVGHPYNLPPPAPPSTPRTTRRLMLSTEFSESLRRNLLWERQASKVNLAAAVRRTTSDGGGGSQHGGLQPLTAMTASNMVQLLPKGTMVQPNPGSPVRSEQEGGEGATGKMERKASGGGGDTGPPAVYDENEREERRKLAIARNRGWANHYHVSGW